MTEDKSLENSKIVPQEWEFHYLKNSDFKTIYATGIIGGVTLNGLINFNLYADRNVIPQTTFQRLDASGKLMEEIAEKTIAKGGTVREVFCGVLMDVNTAESFYTWLGKHIEHLKEVRSKSQKLEL